MLKKADNCENNEDVSYDVESLFTNTPVKETIEYVLHKIYGDKSIKVFCKKSIFKNPISKINKRTHFPYEFLFNKAN